MATGPAYSGPMPLAQAHRYSADSRDGGFRDRRKVLAGEFTDDVWSGFMEGAIRSGQRAAHLLDPSLPPPAPGVH